MKSLLCSFLTSSALFLLPQIGNAETYSGQEALKILENGKIINETVLKQQGTTFFGIRRYTVIYNSNAFSCEINQQSWISLEAICLLARLK